MSAEKVVELDLNLARAGAGARILVDGENIAKLVRAVRLDAAVDQPYRVVLDLGPTAVRASLLAEVAVDEMTHEFLTAIGWTPPAGGEL